MNDTFATEHVVARLRKGDIIQLPEGEAEVLYVNLCRAHVQPRWKEKITIQNRFKDGATEVSKTPSAFNISPNSEVPILSRT